MSAQPLEGKVGVVFGVANKRSIAWAIAQAWHSAGAKLIFNYQGERLKENVEELTSTFGADVPAYPCDVSSDEQISEFFRMSKSTPTIWSCCYIQWLLPPRKRWKAISLVRAETLFDRSQYQCVFVGRSGPRSSPIHDERWFGGFHDLLRLGKSCTSLQRDGRSQSEFGSDDSLPWPMISGQGKFA